MFGVVVCPRCGRAKGVDLRKKTTACACGFEIRVVPARVRARTDSTRELAALVGRANADLAGGRSAYEAVAAPRRRTRSRNPHLRVVAAASKPRDRAGRIRAAAIELTRELEVFSFADWARVMEALGIPSPEDSLRALLHGNAVFEPRPGFYRAVDLSP